MRTVFLALLSANLLFLAWARWIDAPAGPGKQDALARLPRLLLVTEAPPSQKPTSASAQKMVFREAVPAESCISVGPFNDMASTARTAAMLLEHGFTPRQRAEDGETVEGYWVYVEGMKTDDDVTRVVQRLEKSGFTDAHVMKESAEGRRVSVGLFSKRERADRRASAVKHMGLDPQVAERKFPGTVYWVDVFVRDQTPLPPELLQPDGTTGKAATQACPAGVGPAPAPEAPQPMEGEDKGGAPAILPRTKVASAPGVP